MSDEEIVVDQPSATTADAEATKEVNPEVKPEEAAEQPPKAETADEPAQPENEGDDEPRKRLSHRERLKRRIAAISTELESYKQRFEELERAKNDTSKDPPPKEEDFNGDVFAYSAAKAAYDARHAVRAEFAEKERRELTQSMQRHQTEALNEMYERVEEVKPRIPDFDKVLSEYHDKGGRFAPHVREELLLNENPAGLVYYLAKNPGVAAELNAMSPRDAAREIGRLEAKVGLPQPKKQTNAPAPIKSPAGGAAPARDLAALAKSEDVSDYVAERMKQEASRRR